ncbi:MAG: histidine triad nucleotide-binding protein [Thermodesulfovibrionaceae bacterium]
MSCIFCRIAKKELPSKIVYEDDSVLAFEDIAPQAPIHILVIPKKHYSTVLEIDDKTLIGHIFTVINEIAQQKRFSEKGFRVVVNCNSDGGQTVYHLHFHILAGRRMFWPPG